MKKQKRKKNVYDTALELYNDLLGIYFDEYSDISDAEKKMECKYKPRKLVLKAYNYEW